jgi:hypothetical protein
MKKIIMAVTLLVISFNLFSQTRNFDGIWAGKILKEDSTYFTIFLLIDSNKVEYVDLDENENLTLKNFDFEKSYAFGQHLNYMWTNTGGIWTETQMFSMVWINSKKLSVHFMRHVSNIDKESKTDDNSDWGYTGVGYLNKL